MHLLTKQVKTTIGQYNMFDDVTKVIIAFSAGPDSVCVLDILHNLVAGQIEFELVYVNHGLRPSVLLRREEKMTQHYASRYKAKHKIIRVKVPKRKEGIEASARFARYRALDKHWKKTGAQRIVLGHNLDDFVETFLLNVVRGSGMRGLRSIAAVRRPYCRRCSHATSPNWVTRCARSKQPAPKRCTWTLWMGFLFPT